MAEKLFSEDEITALSAEIRAKTKAAMAEPGAKAPVVFTNGLLDAIMSAIVTGTRAAVRKARTALDPLQAAVGVLVDRVDAHEQTLENHDHRLLRNSEHTARIETRLAALERKVGIK